jgi:hypothetical protein
MYELWKSIGFTNGFYLPHMKYGETLILLQNYYKFSRFTLFYTKKT